MLIGYARVSRDKQETALQLDALDKAGCQRVYVEKLSGASTERPELERCLDTLREGDTLIVWHLDRLGRSIKDLIEIVSSLKRQGIGFRSLTQSDIDTTTANGALGGPLGKRKISYAKPILYGLSCGWIYRRTYGTTV